MWRRRTRWPRLLHNFQPRTPRTPRSNGRAGPRKQTCWTAHAKFGPPPRMRTCAPLVCSCWSDSLLLCTFGAQVLLLISSERGQIYSFATPKLADPRQRQLEAADRAVPERTRPRRARRAAAAAAAAGAVDAASMPAPQHYMAQPGMSQPGMLSTLDTSSRPDRCRCRTRTPLLPWRTLRQPRRRRRPLTRRQPECIRGYMMAPDGSMVPNAQMPCERLGPWALISRPPSDCIHACYRT